MNGRSLTDISSVSVFTGRQLRCSPESAVRIADPYLVKSENMALRKTAGCFLRKIRDAKETSAFIGNLKPERYIRLLMRSNMRYFYYAVFDFRTVLCQAVVSLHAGRRIREIPVVPDCEKFFFRVINCPERPVHIFVFVKASVGCPVRVDQTVETEIAVMLKFAVVSAIQIHGSSVIRISFQNRVIAEFPDKASAKALVLLRQVSVLLKISRAVPHGMAILHKQKRLFRIAIQIVCDFIERRIHSAEEIDIRDIVLSVPGHVERALIVGKPCGICLFRPAERFFKCTSVPALISHGPDEDARSVPIAQDHGFHAVKSRQYKCGIVRNLLMSQPHAL